MEAKIVWLFVFVALYWAYCIFWGIKGAISARTASDYFIAGRRISLWVFVLAATATSFSGWTFMGHPGLIYRDGFQYAYASFYTITIPFTGVMFLKRQWIIGKRFGFVTPGEMLSYYFRSDSIRLLVILVALAFSVPYLGVQLRASGYLFNVLTDGRLSIDVGMWVLSAVVFIYVASGGLRAVAYVDTLQCILLAAGIVIIGVIAVNAVGGWDNLQQDIALLSQADTKRTPDGYSHYIAIPGVIQFVSTGPSAEGGAWTGVMILTYMFALMGIQSAPAFSMWAFSNRDPAPFAPQQVWASSFGIGLILFVFTAMQGMGGHFLGADLTFAAQHPDRVAVGPASEIQANLLITDHRAVALAAGLTEEQLQPVATEAFAILGQTKEIPTLAQVAEAGGEAGTAVAALLQQSPEIGEQPALLELPTADSLVAQLINLMANTAPWLVGLLSVCALAAMQSTGAAYMSTAGGMITRDLIRHFMMPNADHRAQKLIGRIGVGVIVLLALIVASTSTDALVLLGGLAVAYGFQMWPALIAVCYWPWLTRQGVVLGLIAGLIGVTLADMPASLGIEAWGRWPWTIHSAGWGIICNLAVALLVSAMTRDDLDRKMEFHSFLAQHASLPLAKRKLIPTAWIITLAWFFFGIGPGAVIGNWIFGNPNDPASWIFGMPSIWAWQLLFWALGVAMMWFLAYVMQMSTAPETEVESLAEDIAEIERERAAT
ncbi:MAG: sodium:solute symporter family protein [Geminicoccaceae bacterium]